MNAISPAAMQEATRLTRAGRLAEATAVLQRMLAGTPAAAPPPGRPPRLVIDGEANADGVIEPPPAAVPDAPRAHPGRARGPIATSTAMPAGAQFLHGHFASADGIRDYRLYVPASLHGGPAPLVVMLHGCTQSPEDFAAGTAMNARAEEHGCLVAYPRQPASANAQKCWNWFSPGDQRRGQGEPALIVGITRQIMRDHRIDPRRVFVAGLSAGGAAAAVMGQAYPELYAAIGVHSGLACGAARDIPSAFAAMRHGATGHGAGQAIPAIVFHADKDGTVHPGNADAVVAQCGRQAGLTQTRQRGQVPGGHAYDRTVHADAQGRPVLEQWLVHGGGHAWSGGSAAGSFTDPRGPDASSEMLRFFLEHPLDEDRRRCAA